MDEAELKVKEKEDVPPSRLKIVTMPENEQDEPEKEGDTSGGSEVGADTRKREEKEENSRPQSGIFNRRIWDEMEQEVKEQDVKESEGVKAGEEEVEQGLNEEEVKELFWMVKDKEEEAKKKEEVSIDKDDLPMILIKD